MSRPNSPISVEKIDPAIAYAQRALDRGMDAFKRGRKETQRSLTTLRQCGLTLRRAEFAAQANTWFATHLTAEGRRSMLVALRQRKAAEDAKGPRHLVRLTAETHADVARLAEQLGMPAGSVIAALAKTALTDPGLAARLTAPTP